MDKKSLIREYREARRPMGIYCVKNSFNGKLLVGKSVDLPSILNRQSAQLRSGFHPNPTLQKDLVKYGADAFKVEILDTLETSDENRDFSADLRTLEQMWLEKLSPFGDKGYNPEPKRKV